MKATFDLPEDLMIAAKKRAAELRRPMRELVERGLRAQLRPAPATRARASRARATIRWVTVPGELAPGLDVADRAARWTEARRSSGRATSIS